MSLFSSSFLATCLCLSNSLSDNTAYYLVGCYGLMVIAFNLIRWHNHLNPNIKKDAWTLEEERALIDAHRIHGNKWAEIAKVLPGR